MSVKDGPQITEFVATLTEIQLPLRLYLQSLMPGDAAAHDVMQQANATLWRKRDEFAPGTNLRAWAFSVARYEVLNHRKQQARHSRLVFGEELEQVLADDLIDCPDDTERRQEALRGWMEVPRRKRSSMVTCRPGRTRPRNRSISPTTWMGCCSSI